MFVPLIPHAQVIHSPRNKAAFCDTKEETSSEESGEILGDAHEGANDAPYEREGRKPESWIRAFEDDVGRDLQQDVADEVHGQCREVLVPGLIQVMVRAVLAVDGERDVLMCRSVARPSMRAFPTGRR